MTVCIVVSAAGVPLSKHVCFLSGLTDVALGHQTHCCGEKTESKSQSAQELKTKCCELSVSHERVDQSASHFNKVELQKLVSWLPVASPLPFPQAAKQNVAPARLLVQNRPAAPPLYGRTLLVRLQTFRI